MYLMISFNQFLVNDAATQTLGQRLANSLPPAPFQQALVCSFVGEIGAGKTTLIRAMLRQLGITGAIKSPTFAIVEEYSVTNLAIYHFDCYRINEPEELDYIGFADYFNQPALALIEWPELAGDYLPSVDLCFSLDFQHNGREITITSQTQAGIALLNQLGTE